MPKHPNPCKWPTTTVLAAETMLEEIRLRAEQATDAEIDPAVRQHIVRRADECKDADLENKAGKHVCDVTVPTGPEELRGLWERTEPERMPAKIGDRPQHWATIATELQSFPSGS